MNLNGIILSKLVYLKIVKSAKTNLTIVKFYFFRNGKKRSGYKGSNYRRKDYERIKRLVQS